MKRWYDTAWVMIAMLIGLTIMGAGTGLAATRDLTVMPKVAAGSVAIGGDYWALLIGIDEYQHVPKLQSAVRDAQAVREVLVQRYGFARDHVTELINGQATREGIENALYQLRKKAGKDDSMFIYYAGHGQIDQEDQIGYWVPVEGKAQSPGTFVSNVRIRDEIARMKAKHVYLVADSCFSGSLFASGRALPPLNDKFFQRLYANKSRWGLTSGQNEPVTDAGKDGHSMFAYFFLKLLQENDDPYLVPSHIYDQIAPLIGRNTDQQPRSEPLQNAGDEGGQFVFRLVSASPNLGEGRVGAAPGAALSQAEQELKALQEQEKQVEERKKLAAIQQQIEEEKKKIEVASLPSYNAPKQMGHEITGKDGAPMVLVPAGEFLYGNDKQRLSLRDFYMDKYEVTTKLYAAFMKGYHEDKPKYWEDARLPRDEELPVIGVKWAHAVDYCRYYGKRLPTEQEWEKAARGTEGPKFPWGGQQPTPNLANYVVQSWGDLCGPFCNAYEDKLKPVNSYAGGQSPYGIFNLAGNVAEWTSSEYDAVTKVVRGGSWGLPPDGLRSTNRIGLSPRTWDKDLGFRCTQDAW